VLRSVFGTETEEVTGGCRQFHDEELHNMYASLNIIRVIKSWMKRVGHAVRMGEFRNTYRILVGKPERKRHLARPKHKFEGNIGMDLK